MKIVIIDTTIDGELIGGAQTFLPKLLKGLIEKGNEVHLITKGIPNEKIRIQIEESKVTLHTNLWDANKFVEENVSVLAEWINHLSPDIYLISVSADIGWLVLPFLKPQIATLTIGHTDSETFYLPARHYHSFLTRAIGVSPEVAANYALTCKLNEEQIDWIPYGVTANEKEPQEESRKLKIIYVGRLEEEQKRISDLIKVVKLLSKQNIDFSLQIVGDGEEMLRIEKDLRQEIAGKKVVLHGWLTSEKVIEAMREADVFILTSAYEGFCIALTEAMANGCCPVVTDINSGNKKLIKSGTNGFLIPIGNVREFAERLKYLSENRNQLLQIRKRAWETGKEYSVERMIKNYESCFQKAIQEAQANPRKTCTSYPIMETCRSRFPLWLRRLKKQFVSAN